MEQLSVDMTYATALFEAAGDAGIQEQISEEAHGILDVFQEGAAHYNRSARHQPRAVRLHTQAAGNGRVRINHIRIKTFKFQRLLVATTLNDNQMTTKLQKTHE